MRLIFPVDKRYSYGVNPGPLGSPGLDLPPFRGPIHLPVCPNDEGHFDTIPIGTLEFAEAHVFGTVRFVLDVWEGYFGRRIEWHFARDYRQLEIVIQPRIDNAYAGYGFMEIGAHPLPDGGVAPFALNFDVMAHELGHLIIYSTIGLPSPAAASGEYYGFHEAAADATALLAVMHFESLLRHLLDETHGNLYTHNELGRFAELAESAQIRLASNDVRLSEFSAGWDDEHALSQPLTGALFDVAVDIYQEMLVDRRLISSVVAEATRFVRDEPEQADVVQPVFDAAYEGRSDEFRAALIDARDYMGAALAETWRRLTADNLSYLDVALILVQVDNAMSGGRFRRAIVESFDWREIGRAPVGPRLKPPGPHSHAHSVRTITPALAREFPAMCYRERAIAAGLVRSLRSGVFRGGQNA
jgi:hypothetical protein